MTTTSGNASHAVRIEICHKLLTTAGIGGGTLIERVGRIIKQRDEIRLELRLTKGEKGVPKIPDAVDTRHAYPSPLDGPPYVKTYGREETTQSHTSIDEKMTPEDFSAKLKQCRGATGVRGVGYALKDLYGLQTVLEYASIIEELRRNNRALAERLHVAERQQGPFSLYRDLNIAYRENAALKGELTTERGIVDTLNHANNALGQKITKLTQELEMARNEHTATEVARIRAKDDVINAQANELHTYRLEMTTSPFAEIARLKKELLMQNERVRNVLRGTARDTLRNALETANRLQEIVGLDTPMKKG